MEKILKNREGITLISLVVTVIILLILAGISIGMLSGDNGILGQAGNAKTQTEIEGEKEIINLAVVGAMNKSKYGDIDETYFTNELEKNNATVTKFGSKYKITFPSERQYTVDQDGNVKEKNPNALEISELNENASTYFGWDVINYAETLSEELQDTEWQLFYAGALDGETEERIYLISKGYVKNTVLPAKDGAKPKIYNNKEYEAAFGATINDGIMPKYLGSTSIATNMQKYNKDYFKSYTSTNQNMKAVAYMLDTDIWSSFSTSSKGYADFSIGGPTIELLFMAYNRYKNLTGNQICIAKAKNNKGYSISKNGGLNYFSSGISSVIESDTIEVNNPYSVSSLNIFKADSYWLASPLDKYEGSDIGYSIMKVNYQGGIYGTGFNGTGSGFRPIVLLKSNFTLEKTKDTNGNDAFKIVEQ